MLIAGLSLLGCAGGMKSIEVRDTQLPLALKQLVAEKPAHFSSKLTLITLLDATACSGGLIETEWWPEWKSVAGKSGCGYFFASSKADSFDVATALKYENNDAPVLVLPLAPNHIYEIGIPLGNLPFKLLVKKSGRILVGWGPIKDSAAAHRISFLIDSLAKQQ